jgi:hypothetical protein
VTTPQIITRALTFNFAASVSSTTNLPGVIDISLIPLASATDAQAGATFAGGLQSTTIELDNPINSWTVNLIPSFSPGLSAPINYRVLWRSGLLGPTTTYDFSMPDEDLTFDDLIAGTGNIISGESYIQQTDIGVPGGVAGLDSQGNVLNAEGVICATEADITAVNNSIVAQANASEVALNQTTNTLSTEINVQTASTLSSAQAYTNTAIGTVNSAMSAERASRISGDANLQSQVSASAADIGVNTSAISTINAELSGFATLTNGFLTVDQIPPSMFAQAFPVANQAAMLALSSTVVHQGDLAVRPDGIFLLVGTDPSQLSNWQNLSVITSVNGQRGAVQLAASDVGAIPVGGSVSMAQVTGLNTALLGLTSTSTTAALQGQVTTLTGVTTGSTVNNSAVATFLSTGILPDSAMPADAALVNSSNQVVSKTGGLVGGAGGSGGTITEVNGQTGPVVTLTAASVGAIATGGLINQSQVTGLTTALSGLVSTSDPRLSNARTPILHAATHASGGSDPVTLTQAQVTGLSALVSGNALTPTSNAINRISTLEGQVAGGGGGGDGGGSGTTSIFWTSANIATDVTDFTTINLHSPFGIDSDGTITGTVGTQYYLYTGVRTQDVAYAYISSAGHLKLVPWNEANAPDPTYALESDLAALTTTVGTLATASSVAILSATIDTLATASALATLQTQVNGCATTAQLTTTNATVATMATAASLATLQTQVNTLAPQSQVTTLAGEITSLQSAASGYATLTSGVLTSSQIPTGIPQGNITGLSTALAACATLTGPGSTVPLAQLPINIPQASIAGLSTTLGGFATLTSGVLTTAEIPPQVLPNIQIVANQAAMLALTNVFYGNMAIVTGGTGQGTYVLTSTPSSSLSSWTLITTAAAPVTSVNDQTGSVVLAASDVGALASNASIPITQITGLSTQLSTFATASALTTGLAAKTAFTDVENMISASSLTKRADYVATAVVPSLSGLQSVDGVLVTAGAIILTTAQPSSVNNGLWVASAGSWTRAIDYSTGSYVSADTLVFIANQSSGANGTTSNGTIWQMQTTSGFIGTALTTWVKIGYVTAPFVPAQGNGVAISGATFSAQVAATIPNPAVSGATLPGGIQLSTAGLAVDPNTVPRKFVGTVPASNPAAITHNLGTSVPTVSIWNTSVSPAQLVLAGVTINSPDSLNITFANTPTTGQYTVAVVG